ncbi:alpha/beta hydrolase [Yokenella regensburgei]|uniref:alpha/beta fold hydrolase n=1 Tax=Yokenella regensburgei TaxID=158877 RepID=UPI0027D9A42D|nr:alpha/beta fold hydrolase [Yokenella regensburgei]MDQ4428870.1 alpha/beta hydrolase [Yokenella regensburgei]
MDSFFSDTANCRVRWMDLPGHGTPLVFVHGLGCASSYEYPCVVTNPAFGGRRAILLDLPGCGYSEKPQQYSYTITEQARVVVELIIHLQLPQYFLYGHSMGGSISIEAAELLGNGLKGLIVSEPNFHPGGGFFSSEIFRHDEATFVTDIWRDMITQENSPWAGSLAADAPWAIWRGAASLVAGNNWLDKFFALEVAKHVVFAERSLPDKDFSFIQEQGVPTQVLPNCGHSMSWENPGALAQALADCCQD